MVQFSSEVKLLGRLSLRFEVDCILFILFKSDMKHFTKLKKSHYDTQHDSKSQGFFPDL